MSRLWKLLETEQTLKMNLDSNMSTKDLFSNFTRSDFTIHGSHMNIRGKIQFDGNIAEKIARIQPQRNSAIL